MRKGQYDVGVNSGDCDNIETVSFRKRESHEALNEELRFSPPKHKKLSPLGKRPQRSHSDAISPEKLKIKINISPKRKQAEHLDINAKTPKASDLSDSEPKRTSSLKYEVVKANDYSVIEFEHEVKARKALDIDREAEIKNNCVAVDDSAVDLDDDPGEEPGYESLNDVKQRIDSKDFSSSRLSDRIKDLTDFHSENVSVNKADCNDLVNNLKTTFDDSALNLSETNLNSSKIDALTSSSKSRDSGFESAKPQNSPDSVPVGNDNFKPGSEDYDEDELEIDPGYAECADAIKGTLPFAAYSDGSGSKLSSCQSLDAPVDEEEPDYAECADALKGGAVRMRISVSNERLAEKDKKSTKTKSNEHIKNNSNSELYANPQILFKKRSRVLMTDRSSGEFSNRSSETDRNESFTFSSSESLHRDVKEEQTITEAPPLPARNYSLYLDNEEAAQLLPDEMQSQNVPNDNTSLDKGQELKQADDSAFEDFGYASVDEVKRQTVVVIAKKDSSSVSANKNNEIQHEAKTIETHTDMVVKLSKENEFNDFEDFGYASVKETKNAKLSDKSSQESKNTSESDISGAVNNESCISETNVSKHKADIDFGYASVQDIVRKDELMSTEANFQGSKSENILKAEMRESVGNKETGLNDNRSSFEIAKLRHVKLLEDKFGYASVNDIKRQSDDLSSVTESNSDDTMNVGCDTFQQNTDKCDEKLDDFGYTSVKESSKITTEQKPDDYERSSKSLLKLEPLDFSENNTKLIDFDKEFTTSPVSEVVSSTFLCSAPQTVTQIKPESVPIMSSRQFEEDSMEVRVHDREGSCRVLRITEKEEPAGIIEKRKSLRSSKKIASQNRDLEKSNNDSGKENFKMLEETISEQDQIDHLGSEIEKLKLIVSSTPVPNISVNRPQFGESDLDTLPADHIIGFVSAVEADQSTCKQDASVNVDREMSENLCTDCATVHKDSCSPKNTCEDSKRILVDALKLPARTNIQKVSYRSVTDSDSDDSDLKIENLPKLVIDESVFDDSDSSESLDKNITALSQTISNLTEQIEKDLCVSETSNSISDKKTEESLRGLTESPEVLCSCTHDNETDVNEIILDSDLSKTVDQKQIGSFDRNTTKLTDIISDLSETNKSLNTSEDLNEPIQMSLEEVINEPIHMTLEDVLKQRHSEVFKDNSETDINHATGSLEILDNADNCSSLRVTDNIDIENECLTSLRESLPDRDKIETKHKAISESQSVNVRTEIENLHLDATGLSLLNCDSSLHASDRADDLVDPVPPRPPPPVFHSPDNTEQGQHLAEESEDNEDQRIIADLRSPSSEDAEQVSDMLPLVFRPGSGSNQADSQEDDSPPAIPPRVRIRKHAKQGRSYTL